MTQSQQREFHISNLREKVKSAKRDDKDDFDDNHKYW